MGAVVDMNKTTITEQFINYIGFRRRVGKTDLVNSTYKNDFTFKHTGLYKKTKKEQLKQFELLLQKYGKIIVLIIECSHKVRKYGCIRRTI